MKAKQYAEKYTNSSLEEKDKTLYEIARMFIGEIDELKRARNAKFDRALLPILKELNQKWMKFAEIVNTKYYPKTQPIKYEGFQEIVRVYFPPLFQFWNSST